MTTKSDTSARGSAGELTRTREASNHDEEYDVDAEEFVPAKRKSSSSMNPEPISQDSTTSECAKCPGEERERMPKTGSSCPSKKSGVSQPGGTSQQNLQATDAPNLTRRSSRSPPDCALDPEDLKTNETEEEDTEEDSEITKHWKSSPFAVGRVKKEWADELVSMRDGLAWLEDDSYAETSCRMAFSGLVCGKCLHAGRVGNMSILCRVKQRLICVAGPYWFVPLFVTIPLIAGVSAAIGGIRLHHYSTGIQIGWICCTCALFMALLCVSCNNPGILRRRSEPENEDWTWNDQALTYRPKRAIYDRDCAVVIEGFDHVCPWTGTAIGRQNMPFFQLFLLMICVCLIFDVLLVAF